jgi:hypothetical protein
MAPIPRFNESALSSSILFNWSILLFFEEEIDIVMPIIRGFGRAIILWLISQKPMSGFAIIKEIEKLTGQKFHAGIVYPLLYELEK